MLHGIENTWTSTKTVWAICIEPCECCPVNKTWLMLGILANRVRPTQLHSAKRNLRNLAAAVEHFAQLNVGFQTAKPMYKSMWGTSSWPIWSFQEKPNTKLKTEHVADNPPRSKQQHSIHACHICFSHETYTIYARKSTSSFIKKKLYWIKFDWFCNAFDTLLQSHRQRRNPSSALSVAGALRLVDQLQGAKEFWHQQRAEIVDLNAMTRHPERARFSLSCKLNRTAEVQHPASGVWFWQWDPGPFKA